ADPPLIVVSQRRPVPGSRDPLDPPPLPSARVLRTWQGGAIRFRWTNTGLAAESFVDHDAGGNTEIGWTTNLKLNVLNMIRKSTYVNQIVFSTLGIVLGLALCGTLAVIEWGAWALVRPGRRLQPAASEPPPWEPIEATAADGLRLRGAWHWAAEASGRTVVLLHGFAEDRSALQGRAEALLEGGWNVALIDARGRGRSDGDLTSFGGREADDQRVWIDALTLFVGPALTPVLWGRSMGAAIALRAASIDPRIRALILEAPYADLRPTVATWLRAIRIPGLFAGSLLRRAERLAGVALHRPRPIDLAPQAALPVLILHGEADPVVSLSDVRRLASAFPTPPSLFEVPEARHGDVFDVGGPDLARRVLDFLNGAVPLPAATEVRSD
ncbi:MAG: alpha/beta hydrolase, partial [Isosphaeraceae bacterium]